MTTVPAEPEHRRLDVRQLLADNPALVLTFANSNQSALLLVALALVAFVFLRSLGYVRFDRMPESAVDRKRNRALRAALRPLGRKLRKLRTLDEIWQVVVEAAKILNASSATLTVRADAGGAAQTPTSLSYEVEGSNPSATFRFSFFVPGSRTLDLGWDDGRREMDATRGSRSTCCASTSGRAGSIRGHRFGAAAPDRARGSNAGAPAPRTARQPKCGSCPGGCAGSPRTASGPSQGLTLPLSPIGPARCGGRAWCRGGQLPPVEATSSGRGDQILHGVTLAGRDHVARHRARGAIARRRARGVAHPGSSGFPGERWSAFPATISATARVTLRNTDSGERRSDSLVKKTALVANWP